MHKTFISYHHDGEQDLKDELIRLFGGDDFIDASVSDGDIDTSLPEDRIMEIIRTNYLQDSTVTLVLIGQFTAQRPYVNTEIRASLWDTTNNKHNGLLAVIRDEIYNSIFTDGTCSTCGAKVRLRNESLYKLYLPNLIQKNHTYDGEKCHYTDSEDVYCSITKYSTFKSNPEFYVNNAYDKRDSDLPIKKKPDPGTPSI